MNKAFLPLGLLLTCLGLVWVSRKRSQDAGNGKPEQRMAETEGEEN